MKPPVESDGPWRLSAPWWAWAIIGTCSGIAFVTAVSNAC